MLIGLLSDTHVPDHAKGLPDQLRDVFRGVDLILHAGDIYLPKVLDDLESIAPVKAAWGDDDLMSDLGADPRMVNGRTLLLDGITLWLTHVRPPHSLITPRETSSLVKLNSEDPKDPPNVVVYGHTHQSNMEYYNDILFVNPGSATFPNYVSKPGSVALLTIDSGKAEARIIHLE